MFDRTVDAAFKLSAPPVLYHYTTWAGAEGILINQQFWATAHDCTNDEAELTSANVIISQAAKELLVNAKGAAAEALSNFLDCYPRSQVANVMTVYLTCFSVARDDSEQWRKYADDGRGLCLGVRILNETPPRNRDLGIALLKVEYSESSWRAHVTESFGAVCALLTRAAMTRQNIALGTSALQRIAAFEAVSAKRENWSVEREYRHVVLIHPHGNAQPNERISGGKTIRYLPTLVRAAGKRIALAEIIIGPNQNSADARERLIRLLSAAGYTVGEFEYPEIAVSAYAHPASAASSPSTSE